MSKKKTISPKDEENESVAARRLCSSCVGENFLSKEIERTGEKGSCFYCKERSKTFSIEKMAEKIKIVLDDFYEITLNEPTDFEYGMIKHMGKIWVRSGDPVGDIIQDAASIDSAPADDIREVLEDSDYRFSMDDYHEENPYGSEAHYEKKFIQDDHYSEEWNQVEENLIARNRFFGMESFLAKIFGEIEKHKTTKGSSVVITAGPEKTIRCLYRARVFQSSEGLEAALRSPEKEIGPPPVIAATAGRMNARGISVFYGAVKAEIAISEVRPPVNSRVIVGQFNLTKEIKLLDVDALCSVYVEGSPFDPNHLQKLKHAEFLKKLSGRISKPIMPEAEQFEYLVTQAIADYLSGREDLGLDGVIYPSVWGGEGEFNVVLFQKSARVAKASGPAAKVKSVSIGSHSEEGFEESYWASTIAETNDDTEEDDIWAKADQRQATLQLDRASLTVHRVEQVKFKTDPHPVLWSVYKPGEF